MLLNYTTKVEAARTVAEIQEVLRMHRASSVHIEYGVDSQIEALSFVVENPAGPIAFRLPVNPDAVLKVLRRQHARASVDRAQAVRVAWRIVKDWVEAQMALLETEMVSLEQIFLSYAIGPTGQTLGELVKAKGMVALTAGRRRDELSSGQFSQ